MSKVSLIGITQPHYEVAGCDHAHELVAYAARVSNPENQQNQLTAPQLLRYLIKHKHWSPFEMVSITMEIKTTRDIGRQILRHRSFSFQEFSQRYAQAAGFEEREARLQDYSNKQNSINPSDILNPVDAIELVHDWHEAQKSVASNALAEYEWALEQGIAKEQARCVLPEGMTQTTMYMAGTLRSWIHYCQLRMSKETQKEHRIVAKQCWDIICEQFPDIAEAVVNQ